MGRCDDGDLERVVVGVAGIAPEVGQGSELGEGPKGLGDGSLRSGEAGERRVSQPRVAACQRSTILLAGIRGDGVSGWSASRAARQEVSLRSGVGDGHDRLLVDHMSAPGSCS